MSICRSGRFSRPCLVLVGVTVAALVWRRRCPYLLVGWLWYLGMLVPVIGLVQSETRRWPTVSRTCRKSACAIALAWGAADVCRSSPYRRWLCGVGSALVLAVLMGCAWRQTSFWCDSETLWTHALACTSQNDTAHDNLAVVLAAQGRLDEAMIHCQERVEISPDNAEAHFNLALALARRDRFDEAIVQYRKGLETRPGDVMAR